jgi:hypothetical protein
MNKKEVFRFHMLSFLITGAAFAEPALTLTAPAGATEIVANSNDWLKESWLTTQNPFSFGILNSSKETISTYLTIAIPYNTANGGWSINVGGTTYDYSSFTTGNHPILAGHGVYNDTNGVRWMDYQVGNISAGATANIVFESSNAPNGMLFHFDAFGTGAEKSYFAPFSHDGNYQSDNLGTVVTPEPVSLLLFGLGGAAMALRRSRQKSA